MVTLLSQGWLDRQMALAADLPERPGADAVVEYEVTGGPDGMVTFHTTIERGRITANLLGPAEDPSFTMVVPRTEFRRWLAGETDLQVGFMQGRVKVTGNIGRMLSVLPVTTSDPWREATAALAIETTSD